jgi:hypothetical protein
LKNGLLQQYEAAKVGITMGCAQSKATCSLAADEPTMAVVVEQPIQTPVQATAVRPERCTRLSDRYVTLACKHTGDGLVTLPDGRQTDKRGVYLQAICLNARCGVAYFNLALMIASDPSKYFTLLDGRKLKREGCIWRPSTMTHHDPPLRVRTTVSPVC